MANCESQPICPFYNDQMANVQGMSSIYKRRYCQGDESRCARQMLANAAGKASVPNDLYPNQRDRVSEIIGYPAFIGSR